MQSIRAYIAGAAVAIVTLGIGVTGTVSAAAAPSAAKFVHLCSAAKPGTRECFALRLKGAATPASASPAATPSGYGPVQLQSAYALGSVVATGGAGVTVAIVDAQDKPDAESDLATYRSTFGLPACTTANGCFKKVNQNGATSPLPTPDTGWSGEIALDIEMVSAACPQCHILLVEANSANNSDLDAAVNYAAAHAQVVSNSYGGSETSSETSDSSYNHPGVLILASSGDEGYEVEFPASASTVMAVGGTSLKTASNSRGWTETVWNTSNTEGAGSGCSGYIAQPSWQTANATIKALCSKRAVADVSADADPATGVAVLDTYGSGGWQVYGGTSVSSPLVGAIYAVTGHANATPQYPYSNPTFFNDVTSGQTSTSCTNALCKAQTGWDGPTGIGTPIGAAMAGDGGNPPPPGTVSLSASPASVSVAAGGNATSTITVTITGTASETLSATSSNSAVATATLSNTSFSASGTSTLTVHGVAAGSATITVSASGTASASTSVGVTVTGGGGGGCTIAFTNGGFESGSTGWTASSGVINTDGAYAHSGTGYAWLDGYGTTHTDTLSHSVTFPASCATATLSYWLYINTSETTTSTAYDKLTVTLGSSTLATYSNLNHSTGYVQKTVSVPSSLFGTTSTLKYTGTEDSSLQTSFFLDDIAVAGA